MHFLREHFISKHKKLNTNDYASKAKCCQYSGKNLVYQNQSSIKHVQFLA